MNKPWPRVLLTILVLALSSTAIVRAAPGSAAAEPVTVYLHTAVRLPDSEYTLGQVASVFSPDPARAQVLRGLPLGATPIRPTLLPARAIQERIAAVTGRAFVIGARIALLPGGSVSREQEWFYRALLAFVEAEDTLKVGRIEIELLNVPIFLEGFTDSGSGVEGMDPGWEDRILFEAVRSPYSPGYRRSLSSQVVPGGTMQVSYRVLLPEGGSAARWEGVEGSFRVWVHHFLPVARAAIDLPANRTLSEDVLIFNEEDVSLLKSTFVVQGEPVDSYRTVTSLRRGERIEGERLQQVPAIRAGERVMITFARPGLLVRLPGRALRTGSVGEIVDVRPEATTKRFPARITSIGEVFVESH